MLLYKCIGGGCKQITALPTEDGATINMASSLFGTKTAADSGKPIEPENSDLKGELRRNLPSPLPPLHPPPSSTPYSLTIVCQNILKVMLNG